MNQTDASFMEFGDLAGETNGGYAGEWGFQETGFTFPEVPLQEVGLMKFPSQEAAEPETLFSEEEELALASELLEITTEAELDQFIGRLFRAG